jgi:ubiquinone/menaquinone biosynthesis C-methylase UbiE
MPFTVQSAYTSPVMRQALDDALRPGGLTGTREALEQLPLPLGAVVLDAGCGPGRTAAYLQDQAGCRVIGVDRETKLLPGYCGRNPDLLFACGDICSLPLPNACVDAVFCECVLTLLAHPSQALAEFHRILRPGGMLYSSDMYARNSCDIPAVDRFGTCLTTLVPVDGLRRQLQDQGFAVLVEQDQTRLLTETAGRLVFEYGSPLLFWRAVLGPAAGSGCASRIQALRPGYVLFIARKDADHDR